SFVAAAMDLNVTQAAIAQHVRKLEKDLAEPLLQREGRGVRLTSAGRDLAQALEQGFGVIEDGIEAIRAKRAARPLTITTTPSFATHWLMPRIGDFWSRHPEVALNIQPAARPVDITRDGIDLAIRFGAGSWPGLQAELLTDGSFWVVARPDLISNLRAGCLDDVAHLTWLFEEQMPEFRALVAQEGVTLDPQNTTMLSTNLLVMAGVRAGLGVTIQPKSIVSADVDQGALAKICELSHAHLAYYMVHVPSREPKGLKVFMKWLRAQTKTD
ncbi:MAG: LysR substrate-binding domain-containing protein, partial [Pseudomonadota bacterium]